MRPALTAVLLLALLTAGALPTSAQTAHATSPTLRLYGCADDLTATDDGPRIGPDGRPDCTGDALRLRPAWLASGQDAGLRAALGPRDQRLDLTLRYAPTYWAPAPNTAETGAIARPGAPDEGLFDAAPDGTPGRFDAAFVHDEPAWPHLDPDNDNDRVDFDPHDGLPDRAERHDGTDSAADRYAPALLVRTDLTWFDTTGAETRVPDGQTLVFAPIDGDTSSGADAWPAGNAPTGIRWNARPFAHGTGDDGHGALTTPTLRARIGDTLRFLDHQIVLQGFLGAGSEPGLVIDVQSTQGRTPVTIATGIVLNRTAADHIPATLENPGVSPLNVVTADGARATRRIPNLAGADGPWFAVYDGSDGGEVRLRLGRWVSTEPSANAFIVGRDLHVIDRLHEAGGALVTLAWSRVLLLGPDLRFVEGTELRGHSALSALPLPAPFARTHIALDDLRPRVSRDAHGFLTGTNAGAFGSSGLRLQPDARTPQERARRADPIELVWHHRGDEPRLGGLHRAADDSILRTLVVPFRYVAVNAPAADAVLHSALLDDEGLVVGADASSDSPRATRSFVVGARSPPAVYVDGGLRLYGGTLGHPASADVVRLAEAWLPADGAPAARRLGEPSGQWVTLDARFVPYHAYGATPGDLVPVSDENVDAGFDADDTFDAVDLEPAAWPDNLFDVAPRNHDPQEGAVYGPALQLRYTHTAAHPTTGAPLGTPFGTDSRLVVPVADRDPRVPGVDSLHIDADPNPDAAVLARFWDRDGGATSTGHWRTNGPFDADEDFVDVQSPPILVAAGGDLRLLDHGVRFLAPGGSPSAPARFEILDLRSRWTGASPPILGTVDAQPGGGWCIVVAQSGAIGTASCASVGPAQSGAPYPVRSDSAAWWAEVVDHGSSSATLRLHRPLLGTPEGAVVAGGVRQAWTFEARPDGTVRNWTVTVDVPLGADVGVARPFGNLTLTGLADGEPLPIAPPFNLPYLRVDRAAPPADQGPHGFDSETPSAPVPRTARLVGPLIVRTAGLGQMDAHRYLHLDPTRLLDGDRVGWAFAGAQHADPGPSTTAPGPQPLQGSGPDGWSEALRSATDRGWDRYARLLLPSGHGAFPVHSVRIGALERSVGAGVGDDWRSPAAAVWRYDPGTTLDLYAADRPSPRPPPVTPAPPVTTTPAPPSPSGEAPPKPRGVPDLSVPLGALAVVLAAATLRRTGFRFLSELRGKSPGFQQKPPRGPLRER